MKILLVTPACGAWRGIGRRKLFGGRTFRFSMISLLTVAALSPDDAEIRIVDEQIEPVPVDERFDLVGITAMTALAPRAYQLAAEFRRRGVPVVMGGFHATLCPDEALQHVDAIVSGPAYGAWPQLVADLRAHGRVSGVYHGDLDARPPVHLPRRLMDSSSYVTVNATFATLGCRNACRFCSIHAFHGGRRVARDVGDVASEVAAFRQRFFVLVDDNLTQDRDYALALFRALGPLGKRWVTQCSVELADDAELLTAMRRAGCVGVFLGLETFSEATLRAQQKEIRPPERYRAAVRAFHRRGIFVESGIVFGFDGDTPAVFRDTLRMVQSLGIDAVQATILTPLPGTALHEDMQSRIFDHDLEHYDYRHAVFHPSHMTAQELQAGADWFIRSFYAPWRIAARALRWAAATPRGVGRMAYPLVLNCAYFGRTRRFEIRGWDPAAAREKRRRVGGKDGTYGTYGTYGNR